MQTENLRLALALSRVSGIGKKTLKALFEEFNILSDIFDLSADEITERTGMKAKWHEKIKSEADFAFADTEILFCDDNNISIINYRSANYPSRLTYCHDAPPLLFVKGNIPFDTSKWLAVVGTRNATSYGKEWCKKLVEDLAPMHPIIVSGLAFGIDICAHRAALSANLPTIGVLAHGLDTVYPAAHKTTASQMQEYGGLISEYPQKTRPDAQNFPERNRIIAGMCDGVLVVEGSESGGALITADIAFSYSREVMALPGRVNDTWSKGCNNLIKYNKASLVENVQDVCRVMGWKVHRKSEKNVHSDTLPFLEPNEETVYSILKSKGTQHIDSLNAVENISVGEVSMALLSLELKGLVISLPGKMYALHT